MQTTVSSLRRQSASSGLEQALDADEVYFRAQWRQARLARCRNNSAAAACKRRWGCGAGFLGALGRVLHPGHGSAVVNLHGGGPEGLSLKRLLQGAPKCAPHPALLRTLPHV